jgi:hypothetical protein
MAAPPSPSLRRHPERWMDGLEAGALGAPKKNHRAWLSLNWAIEAQSGKSLRKSTADGVHTRLGLETKCAGGQARERGARGKGAVGAVSVCVGPHTPPHISSQEPLTHDHQCDDASHGRTGKVWGGLRLVLAARLAGACTTAPSVVTHAHSQVAHSPARRLQVRLTGRSIPAPTSTRLPTLPPGNRFFSLKSFEWKIACDMANSKAGTALIDNESTRP